MLGNRVNLGGSDCQKIYEIGKRLGLVKSEDNIKAGDVLLFGNDEYKYHAAFAISRTMALEAYKHYEDENCTGMPILTRSIDEIRRLYKNGKVYVVDFLQKKTFIDGEKYLRDESVVEVHPIVVKSIYNLHCNDDLCYLLVSSISLEDGEVSSFVFYITISSNKQLRNLDENFKLKFYCDFNNSEKKENISELFLINYNCSTEPFDNLNITVEDNLIESIELEDKEEEKYFDLNNVNKRMNISQISNNESSFNIDNLTNYLIFTCGENKTINLTNEKSFILEGQINHELSEDKNLTLSFNNTNDFHMNCVITMNSSLYCSFNESNLKNNSNININIYSIKENEISTNDENIFLVGLNKVEFIYQKEEEIKENEKIKTEGLKLYIIIIIIVVSILILVSIFIIIIFFIRKKKAELKVKNKTVSNKKIGINGNSKEYFN